LNKKIFNYYDKIDILFYLTISEIRYIIISL
jgi:hypothetical protein